MYKTRDEDNAKWQNQEGVYSLYNYIYHYLLDNFEPSMNLNGMYDLLYKEAKAYCLKGGKQTSDKEIEQTIKQAIDAFKQNNGKHGDTADNFGKRHKGQFESIRDSLADLHW